MIRNTLPAFLALTLTALDAHAGALQREPLQREFTRLTQGASGRVGVCALDATGAAVCVNGGQRFSLQSVMKLVVSLAVMDAVDHKGWRLDEPVVVHKEDLSLFVEPIAKLVTAEGYRTTVGDLVRRAIVDSDSAAVDILIARLGGTAKVQAFLTRHGVTGIRLDRDEKHLQTEIVGLVWKPEYIDPAVLDKAIDSIPKDRRTAAFHAYQADPRDTATPEAMARLLQSLADGKLLSPASTKRLLQVMTETLTFPDRLKAGVPPNWTIGHKTGTSGGWQGVTAATNDVAVLTAPDGGRVSLVVFIGDSSAPADVRAALMAKIAAATVVNYQ